MLTASPKLTGMPLSAAWVTTFFTNTVPFVTQLLRWHFQIDHVIERLIEAMPNLR